MFVAIYSRIATSIAAGLSNIAAALQQMGKMDEALAANQRALSVQTKVVEENQNLAVAQKLLATIHDNIAEFDSIRNREDFKEIVKQLATASPAASEPMP